MGVCGAAVAATIVAGDKERVEISEEGIEIGKRVDLVGKEKEWGVASWSLLHSNQYLAGELALHAIR